MKTKFIYEMPVYCGRQKEWRILNLNTGTVYSNSYETEEEAINSIKIGEERAGSKVVALELFDVKEILDAAEKSLI